MGRVIIAKRASGTRRRQLPVIIAKANLAKLFDEGKGGPVDLRRAAKLVLDAARSGNNEMRDALRGDMQKWSKGTRTELKRELGRVGAYKGSIDDAWDDTARVAVGKYLGQAR